jgi:hypothetical protein
LTTETIDQHGRKDNMTTKNFPNVLISSVLGLSLAAGALIPAANGATKPKAGARCKSLTEVQIYGTIAFRCVKKGTKLVWTSKKLTAAQLAALNAPLETPAVAPVATSAPSATGSSSSPATVAPAPAASESAGGLISNPKALVATDRATFKTAIVGRMGYPEWWPIPATFDPASTLNSLASTDAYISGGGTRSGFLTTDYYSTSLDLEATAKALIAQVPATAGIDLTKVSNSSGEQNGRKYVELGVGVTRARVRVTVGEVGPTGKASTGSIASVVYTTSVDATAANVAPPTGAPALAQFQSFPLPADFKWARGEVRIFAFGRYTATNSTSWSGPANLATTKAFFESAAPAGVSWKEVTADRPESYVRKLTYNGYAGTLQLVATSNGTTAILSVEVIES